MHPNRLFHGFSWLNTLVTLVVLGLFESSPIMSSEKHLSKLWVSSNRPELVHQKAIAPILIVYKNKPKRAVAPVPFVICLYKLVNLSSLAKQNLPLVSCK